MIKPNLTVGEVTGAYMTALQQCGHDVNIRTVGRSGMYALGKIGRPVQSVSCELMR